MADVPKEHATRISKWWSSLTEAQRADVLKMIDAHNASERRWEVATKILRFVMLWLVLMAVVVPITLVIVRRLFE
jgi:uncharacterized membrane protein YhaH (DUF805 family)